LRAKTRGQGAQLPKFYNNLTTYFTVLWFGYPIVWLIGSSGFGWINQTIDTLLFCILPFFSKVGFSFLDLHGLRSLGSIREESGVDRAVGGAFHFLGSMTAWWKPRRKRLHRRVRYLPEGMQ
jgi:bacteriorhodopsin